MQEAVNRRTIELQQDLAGGAAREEELAALVQEQSRIAELVAKMTARSSEEQPND
jgi:hypothetical protein